MPGDGQKARENIPVTLEANKTVVRRLIRLWWGDYNNEPACGILKITISPKDNELVWKYLPYVTVSDIIHHVKRSIGVWFIISVFFVILNLFKYGLYHIGFSFDNFISWSIPHWLWVVIISGMVLWF